MKSTPVTNLTPDQQAAAKYFLTSKTHWLSKLMRDHLVSIKRMAPRDGEIVYSWDMREMIRESYAETIRHAAALGIDQATVDADLTLMLGLPFDHKTVKA